MSLAVGTVVLPATSLDRIALSWLIPLTIAFGIAHLVAAVGLVRNRRWSALPVRARLRHRPVPNGTFAG